MKRLPSRRKSYPKSKGTSAFTSEKASVTVEASLAVPIFFFAVVSLLYLLEIMAVQTAVRSGLQYAGKELAKEAYVIPAAVPSRLEDDIVTAIGAARLNRSIVVDGSGGIHCQESYMSANTGIASIRAAYKVKIPVPLFHIPSITYKQEMKIKGWTGYERNGFGDKDEETVYITETGIVYHKNYHCTYLELSIHAVQSAELNNLRNEDGGRYYPCEHCMHGTKGLIYITDTGNKYHNSLSCSGLKRTIYAVPLSEAVGKGACSRCGN